MKDVVYTKLDTCSYVHIDNIGISCRGHFFYLIIYFAGIGRIVDNKGNNKITEHWAIF